MMKKQLMMLSLLGTFAVAGGNIGPVYPSVCGGLYTYSYMPYSGVEHPCIDTGIPNPYSGKMLLNKRVRFHASLYFKEGQLTSASQKKLDEMESIIKAGHLHNYYVSLVGHTAGYEDGNHMVELNGWSTFWQNLGTKTITRTEMAETVNRRIRVIYDHLTQDVQVSPARMYTENRLNRDPISTEATEEGRKLNERVDVVLYY